MVRLFLPVAFVSFVAFPSPDPRAPSPDSEFPSPQPPPPGPTLVVRFHHIHYRVGDPAAAMNAAAAKLEGTRVVVPGLGVGVRAGTEFVLYDRLDESDPPDLLQRTVANAHAAAVSWLKSRGLVVEAEEFASSRIARAPPGRYHHVAFVAADFDAAVARISHAPVKRTSESVLFEAGGGRLVEIVRESDLPDAFWCPMHPDVRSGTAGQCPLCRMDLVLMPPPKVGEYRMDVDLQRSVTGLKGLRLSIREPDTNALVRSFTTVHEKFLHLFIVSRDLEYFAHVHPEQRKDGWFQVDHALSPGEYMLIADFLPANATTQMIQRAVIVPRLGASASAKPADKPAEELRVSLRTENLVAGREGSLTFTVTDAKSGAPVTDLEPYLGAPAHMLLVRSDLSDAVHEHPEEAVTGGPTVSFHPLIPAVGDYKLWIQLQRGGRVLTFPFLVRVEQ